ncbi:MAG: sugar transporter substrate-binding protein [Cryobacterium sp.]|jgi:ABC-type sugar transport system substrate-binding protein|nr:sugar transporter substrate-binding protein [Cryobacterium sp.]
MHSKDIYRGTAVSLTVAVALAVTGCSSAPVPESSSATATTERVSIAFIGDSAPSDAIWSYAVSVMREEAELLGVDFVDRYAGGDFSLQAQYIEEEVARGVDAIIAPFYDPEATNDAIVSALEAGVEVYAVLGVPNLQEDVLAEIGIAQTSWESYGEALGEIALPDLEDGDTVLWPAEQPGASYITGAVEGFELAADAAGVDVTVTVLDAGSDSTESAQRQLAFLLAKPDVGAIVTSGSIAIAAAFTAMTQGGLSAGQPPLAGFITSPQAAEALKQGYMSAGVWTDFEGISRQAVNDLVAMVTEGAPAPHHEAPVITITSDNIDEHIPASLRSN